MNTRDPARGGRLQAFALAACVATTGLLALGEDAGAQAPRITIAGAGTEKAVRYGEPAALSGRAAPGGAGQPVKLEYAPRGHGFRVVARTIAAADGGYRFRLRPRRSGSYRAVGQGAASAARRLTVAARLAGRAARHVLGGAGVRVRGRLAPGFGGRTVRLQLRTGAGWTTVDRAHTGRRGSFRSTWRASRPGRFRMRVRFAGDRRNAGASHSLRGRVHVYRASSASWYGPGLYGNRLACGGVLGYGTLGVAHKTLPCGTRVTLRYRGRSVNVPVVDRGPFVGGREWDLTSATKQRLGFGNLGSVWVAY